MVFHYEMNMVSIQQNFLIMFSMSISFSLSGYLYVLYNQESQNFLYFYYKIFISILF